ncbi:MAG: ATP-binding protein [Acidimicrobiales bacterium]
MPAPRRPGEASAGSAARRRRRGRRVLVVAPEAPMRAALAAELVDYSLELVADVSAGLRAVARDRPATVVLGLPLAELAGHGIVTRIRVFAPYARVVVCVTDGDRWSAGSDGHDDADTAEVAGAITRSVRSLDPAFAPTDPAASISVPAHRGSPSIARRFTRAHLQRWRRDDLVDDAALLVSELVTNAVFHTRQPAFVRLVCGTPMLRVEVRDAGAGTPELLAPNDGERGGRGLTIVSSLARAWGVSALPGGKVVWAELAR